MRSTIFVYGTLKEDFANFHLNAGRRIDGTFETVDRFPLYILGEVRVPWLVDRRGDGEHVVGQLFEVDAVGLARMDRLERVGEPGWYFRREIVVRARQPAPETRVRAQVYFGAAERLDTDTVHAAGLAEFLPAHDRLYRQRPT